MTELVAALVHPREFTQMLGDPAILVNNDDLMAIGGSILIAAASLTLSGTRHTLARTVEIRDLVVRAVYDLGKAEMAPVMIVRQQIHDRAVTRLNMAADYYGALYDQRTRGEQ